MKKLLTLILITNTISFAQFPPAAFEWYLGDEGIEKTYDMVQDNFGNRYFVGYTEDVSEDRDLWIFKLDRFGNEVWSNEIIDGGSSYGNNIGFNGDSTLTIAGKNNGGYFLATFDTSGTVLWQNDLGYADYFGSYIGFHTNGDISVLLSGSSNTFMLCRLNLSGDLLWEQAHDVGAETMVNFVVEENEYFIFGTTTSEYLFLKLSEDGSLAAEHHIDATLYTAGGATHNSYAYWPSIIRTASGDFLAGAILSSGGNLLRFTEDAEVIFSIILESDDGPAYTVRGIVEATNGAYCALNLDDLGRIQVHLISSTGEFIASNVFGPEVSNFARHISIGMDGNIEVVGYHSLGDPYGIEPWFASLDIGGGVEISEIVDTPQDQGGWVTLTWGRSSLDGTNYFEGYGIWEQDPVGSWVSLGSVPAMGNDSYSFLAHTFQDSGGVDNYLSHFAISSHTSIPDFYGLSQTFSGYSIDNISPGSPQNLAGQFEENGVDLSWNHVGDFDFDHYRIYRSTSEGFVPGAGDLLGEIEHNEFRDESISTGEDYYYLVAAVDYNGNEGLSSSQLAMNTLSNEDENFLPTEFKVLGNYPNPFNPSTSIQYLIPEASTISISVHDLRGGLVVSLLNKVVQEAGSHSIQWEAASSPAGIYLVKIEAGDEFQIVRAVLIK